MKTIKQIKTIIQLVTLTVALAFTFSCDNKKSTKTTTTTSQYSLSSNGYCIQNSTGQVVTQSLCSSQYSYVNGNCVYTATNQVVSANYCANLTSNRIQCVGTYYFWNNYYWKDVTCNGTNCSGYTLYPPGATSQSQAVLCM